MDLLKLHPSFWAKERCFTQWQLFRRNKEYREWVSEARGHPIGINDRYFKNYPPMIPKENYLRWCFRVRREAPGRSEALFGRAKEIILLSSFTKKPPEFTLPDGWLPIPPEIEFPHPNVLDDLTSSTIGTAVIPMLVKERKKEPFLNLTEVKIGKKLFWVDTNYSLERIKEEILAEFPSIGRTRKKTVAEAIKSQLREPPTKKKERDRKTKDGRHQIAECLVAWDIYQAEKTDDKQDSSDSLDEKAVNKVAERLWKIEYLNPPKRKPVLQRARDKINYAWKQINSVMP